MGVTSRMLELPSVVLVRESAEELRFRVEDPEMYPAWKPYDLVFLEPEPFSGPHELEDVCLRTLSPPVPSGDPVGKTTFEFVSREVVPSDGAAVQVHVRSASETDVVHGAFVWTVVARVTARELRTAPAPAPER